MLPATGLTVPAIFGGLFIGVMSALPLVSAANACCCLWVVAGGMLAAYLLQERRPDPLPTSDGALAGLVAGFIGAFVYLAVALPVHLILSPLQRRIVQGVVWRATDVPPEVRELIESVGAGFGGIAIGFVLMVFAGVLFAPAGGALGAIVFRRTAPGMAAGKTPVPPGAPSPPAA